MKLAILGAGAWGTALALTLSGRHRVTLWGRDPEAMDRISVARINERYLPGHPLPAQLALTSEFSRAVEGADLALLTVPVAGLRETLRTLHYHRPDLPILWACKGFEQGSDFMPHQVVAETLQSGVDSGVLSGPSFAEEVANGLPTAITLSSLQPKFARDISRTLHGHRLRLYSSTDVVGVELAGALKNVIAIASGLSDELGLGLNARAALVTRGLAEIARLGVA
ncbi:MAG: NAD(P)-dependent glycerol-3-phosphate dehydrogenase, partial [Ferrovum sp.]|nr:NAD(P)-dependent glycerol-3-phosphate dehydrogenase [Ferrovum sp.]